MPYLAQDPALVIRSVFGYNSSGSGYWGLSAIAALLSKDALDAYRTAALGGHIKVELGATGYPPDLQSLYAGVEDQASEKKVNLYFLRRIPRDPFFPDGTVPAEETWGLRGYQSPPDDPQPGDDVFDVHSLSGGTGLNGVPYHDW